MAKVDWEVSKMLIETGRGGVEDRLFANGLMQVLVVVEIRAFDPTTRTDYELNDSDLATLKLVDYYDGSEIKEPWAYSQFEDENEFDHVLPGTLGDAPHPKASEPLGGRHIKFWVTTTKAENKSIGAEIEQPDGKVVTTAATGDSEWASRVILISQAGVTYTMNDIRVDIDPVGHEGGRLKKTFYYVSSNRYPFIKSECHGFRAPGEGNDEALHNCFRFDQYQYGHPEIFYIWEMGSEDGQKRVGFSNVTDTIRINTVPNGITLLCVELNYPATFQPIKLENWFKLFDRYGNSGTFYTNFGEEDHKLKIQAHKPGWHKESASD
ncbi:hypothetical protein IFM46972_10059 [Aspergillus udagawae]|uniref:Uncharacterized protein n=1 Tax=Aspergillus udagawae TaxID=91492 RepID=A0A8H3XN91_9EURO|nr:hypothetical protein IFM46972_10059 [Aspergillus udagawae]